MSTTFKDPYKIYGDKSKSSFKDPYDIYENKKPESNWIQNAANDVQKNIIEPVEGIPRAARDATLGLAQSLANAPAGFKDTVNLIPNMMGANIPKASRYHFAPDNPASKVGEFGSFFVGGPLLKLLGKVSDLAGATKYMTSIPEVAKGVQAAANTFSKYPIITSAAKNALIGGSLSNENDTGIGALLGGVGGALAEGLPKAWEAGKRFVGNRYGGELTPDALEGALRNTEGTETPLGDVIASPGLKKSYENVIQKLPFSGVGQTLIRNAKNIQGKGEEILASLLGKTDPEVYSRTLERNLTTAYKKSLRKKNELYETVKNIADETPEAANIDLTNLEKTAHEFRDAIENTTILKEHPESKALLKKIGLFTPKIRNVEKVIPIEQYPDNIRKVLEKVPEKDRQDVLKLFGQPTTTVSKEKLPVSFGEAAKLKSTLNGFIADLRGSPDIADRNRIKALIKLRNALSSDLVNALEKPELSEVKEAYKAAENHYATDFSRFLHTKLYKFANGTADESDRLIPTFLKSGSSDRADLLSKLTRVLSPDDSKLLAYAHLEKAVGENGLNPLQMANLISRKHMGPRQFKQLFPGEELQSKIRNYAELAKRNEESFNQMANKQTGIRNSDWLSLMTLLGLGKTGLSTGGVTGMIGLPSLSIMAGRMLNKGFTNEKVREKIVKELIRQKTSPSKGSISNGSFSQGLPSITSLLGD